MDDKSTTDDVLADIKTAIKYLNGDKTLCLSISKLKQGILCMFIYKCWNNDSVLYCYKIILKSKMGKQRKRIMHLVWFAKVATRRNKITSLAGKEVTGYSCLIGWL